jgi:acetyl esterase/lipase
MVVVRQEIPMTRGRHIRVVVVSIMIALVGLAMTPRPASAMTYTTQLNVVYSASGQKLDVFKPVGGTGHVIIILVHGGGWRSQDKATMGWLGRLFAAYGVTALSVDFRQSPKHQFPAAFNDVRDAVTYAKANARRLDSDPDKVVLMGYSSGANLAALVGLHDSVDVRGVVSAVCVYDLRTVTNPYMRSDIADYMGKTPWGYGSPINLVSPGDPATLIQLGQFDDLATPEQAHRMSAALRAQNVPTTVLSYPTGHGLQPLVGTATVDMLRWVLTVTQ